MSMVDHALRKAEHELASLREAMQMAEEKLDSMRAERRRMNVEMRVVDIADFFDVDPSTVHRWLNKGTLRSKKMIDVLEYQKNRN